MKPRVAPPRLGPCCTAASVLLLGRRVGPCVQNQTVETATRSQDNLLGACRGRRPWRSMQPNVPQCSRDCLLRIYALQRGGHSARRGGVQAVHRSRRVLVQAGCSWGLGSAGSCRPSGATQPLGCKHASAGGRHPLLAMAGAAQPPRLLASAAGAAARRRRPLPAARRPPKFSPPTPKHVPSLYRCAQMERAPSLCGHLEASVVQPRHYVTVFASLEALSEARIPQSTHKWKPQLGGVRKKRGREEHGPRVAQGSTPVLCLPCLLRAFLGLGDLPAAPWAAALRAAGRSAPGVTGA